MSSAPLYTFPALAPVLFSPRKSKVSVSPSKDSAYILNLVYEYLCWVRDMVVLKSAYFSPPHNTTSYLQQQEVSAILRVHVIFIFYRCVTFLDIFAIAKHRKFVLFFFLPPQVATVFLILNLSRITRVRPKHFPIPPASALQTLVLNEPTE